MTSRAARVRAAVAVAVAVLFGAALGGAIGQMRSVSTQLRDVADQIERVEVQTRDWAPLGPYPDQTVDDVRYKTVRVTGTKCFDPLKLPRVVRVRGSVTLISQDGDGVFLPLFNGERRVSPVEPPCVTRTFLNDLPVDEMARHPNVSEWRLVGTEVPIDAAGNEGVPTVWRTQPFVWPPTD